MSDRLTPNVARFPHETIENETILIDSETGHVLLLSGFASTLWASLVDGADIESLLSAVGDRFGDEARSATNTFVENLRSANMIVPAEGASPTDGFKISWPDQFLEPVLERYDDIANIIAMDPIHDVDDTGWPRPAKTSDE